MKPARRARTVLPMVPAAARDDALASLNSLADQEALLGRLVGPEDEPVMKPSLLED